MCTSYESSRGREKDAHSVITVYSLKRNPKDSQYQVSAIVTMRSRSTIVHYAMLNAYVDKHSKM